MAVAPLVIIGIAIVIPLLITGDPEVIGIAAMLTGMTMRIPQLIGVYRAPDVSGVSTSAWWFGFFGSAIWAAYGISLGQIYLIIPSAQNTIISAIVLYKLYARRGATSDSDTFPIVVDPMTPEGSLD